MVAFCLADAKLRVQCIGAVIACSGQLCGGLYECDLCPCVKVSQLPRHVLSVTIMICSQIDNVTMSQKLGIRLSRISLID